MISVGCVSKNGKSMMLELEDTIIAISINMMIIKPKRRDNRVNISNSMSSIQKGTLIIRRAIWRMSKSNRR